MLLYLASPYSPVGDFTKEEKKLLQQERFEQISKIAAKLMLIGYEVFCPIAHSHPIELYGNMPPPTHGFWLKQDYAILKHCDQLWVAKLPGWEQSYGIKKEREFAKTNYIPVRFYDVNTGVVDGCS